MTDKNSYKLAHNAAKTIITALVIVCIMFDTFMTDVVAVIVWFWGVNPVAWIIEEVCHLRHKHDLW